MLTLLVLFTLLARLATLPFFGRESFAEALYKGLRQFFVALGQKFFLGSRKFFDAGL
jgi:hypothetical protein